MPGVEIHAHAVATVLAGNHIRELSTRLQYLWTVLLGALAVWLALRVRGIWGSALALVLAAGALFTAWWFFSERGIWLWSFAPALSVGLAYAGSSATLHVAEEQEKARIRGMFQQYVASSVVDELIKRPELLALGGEERVISVLFSDVADFSTISEPLPDHALRACHAALDMTRELGRLREKWAAENRPRLFARFGLNTGDVLVGNLGSHRIMDYTVMGDHVNLASRLEGANKPYGDEHHGVRVHVGGGRERADRP